MADVNDIINFLQGTVRRGLERAAEPCRMPGCEAFSLGFVCKRCSRFVCQSHGFVTLPVPSRPPQIRCTSCVIDSAPELLDEPAFVPPPEARAPRARASSRDTADADAPPADLDDDVLDAEFEEA